MARTRSTTTTRRSVVASAVVAGLCLAACGGSPAAAPPAGTVTHTTVAAPGALRYLPPDPVARGTALVAVSCTAAQACFALDPSGHAYQLAGGDWRQPIAFTSGHSGPGTTSISCSAAPVCAAAPMGGRELEVWDGQRWSPPDRAASTGIAAIGCAPTGWCLAVDASGGTFDYRGRWRPTAAAGHSASAVSCASATFCVSVSNTISVWDGRTWHPTVTPPVTSPFIGVSCPSTRFCMAVDRLGQALRWDGRSWSTPAAVGPVGLDGASLTAVSCPTASLCVAADDAGTLLTWNGSAWRADDVDGDRPITDLSCPTPTYCVGVDRDGDALVGRAG